jgi:hypothetical protein
LKYPTTPDRRYFLVGLTLWRCTNPGLSNEERERLTKHLMTARRAVATTKRAGDEEAVRCARRRVNAVKIELGERGPVWWTDGSPDYNRHKVTSTPYAAWCASLDR